ncbi:MAG: nucleoside deaminase [Pseudomonadota bacterium]
MKPIFGLILIFVTAFSSMARAEAPLTGKDMENLRAAIDVTRVAVQAGQPPFGAVIAGPDGTILMRGENQDFKLHDHTQHAESALASRFCRKYFNDPELRAKSTLYSSVEPCAMCMFTMFNAGIGRVVYGLSEARAYAITDRYGNWPRINLSSREAAGYMSSPMVVEGPYLEEEVAAIFERAFKKYAATKKNAK